MCERKYTEYIINVKFLNGESEKISYTEYDNSSYKQMIELYNITKDKYKNHCVNIEFTGVTKDGKLEVMFIKEIVTEDKVIKKQAENYCTSDSTKILNNIIESLKDLQKHRSYIKGQVDILNKKENIELHKIEKNKNGKHRFTDKEKIDFFDNIQNIRDERRECKNGNYMIEKLFEDSTKQNINLKKLEKILTDALEKRKKYEDKIEQLTDEKVEEFKLMKIVQFKTFQEKISLMLKLQKQYTKVIGDDKKMTLTCYNKSF